MRRVISHGDAYSVLVGQAFVPADEPDIRRRFPGFLYEALGPKVAGVTDGVVLNFQFDRWSTTCKSTRESCIRSTAVHEFGHVLGFPHENDRPDAPMACQQLFPTTGFGFVGKLITPYDQSSVMNFCNPVYLNDGKLSALDKEKVAIIYGRL